MKKEIKPCLQQRCFYFERNCQPCEKCGAESHTLNINCMECFKCSMVEGESRFVQKEPTIKVLKKIEKLVRYDNDWAN